jgi:hypothetical protein
MPSIPVLAALANVACARHSGEAGCPSVAVTSQTGSSQHFNTRYEGMYHRVPAAAGHTTVAARPVYQKETGPDSLISAARELERLFLFWRSSSWAIGTVAGGSAVEVVIQSNASSPELIGTRAWQLQAHVSPFYLSAARNVAGVHASCLADKAEQLQPYHITLAPTPTPTPAPTPVPSPLRVDRLTLLPVATASPTGQPSADPTPAPTKPPVPRVSAPLYSDVYTPGRVCKRLVVSSFVHGQTAARGCMGVYALETAVDTSVRWCEAGGSSLPVFGFQAATNQPLLQGRCGTSKQKVYLFHLHGYWTIGPARDGVIGCRNQVSYLSARQLGHATPISVYTSQLQWSVSVTAGVPAVWLGKQIMVSCCTFGGLFGAAAQFCSSNIMPTPAPTPISAAPTPAPTSYQPPPSRVGCVTAGVCLTKSWDGTTAHPAYCCYGYVCVGNDGYRICARNGSTSWKQRFRVPGHDEEAAPRVHVKVSQHTKLDIAPGRQAHDHHAATAARHRSPASRQSPRAAVHHSLASASAATGSSVAVVGAVLVFTAVVAALYYTTGVALRPVLPGAPAIRSGVGPQTGCGDVSAREVESLLSSLAQQQPTDVATGQHQQAQALSIIDDVDV